MSIKIRDNGGEFRIEILGTFAGSVVEDVQFAWSTALNEITPRSIVVDITQLSGYDMAGGNLLRHMCVHGTQIAARSTQSLIFLSEISGPVRPTLVRKAPATVSAKENKDGNVTPIRSARVAP